MSANNVFSKCVCLAVRFSMPGDTRKGNLGNAEIDADKSQLMLRKRIFRSEHYKNAWRLSGEARHWVASRALPSPLREGTYLVPEALLSEVEQYLDEVKQDFNALADKFIAEYPELIERQREVLRSQFNEANYPPPEVMRAKFGMSRMIINFQLARPEEIDQQKEVEDTVNEIKACLREGLLELVGKLSKMLGTKKNGRKAALSDKAVERFKEWMDLLPARFVVDDPEFKALADKAKAAMDGKVAADLRDVEAIRGEVRREMNVVTEQLKGLLKDMPGRAISFDD